MKNTLKPLFILLGFLSLGLGILGAFLPLLPTTPFGLLAAYCFSKGSPRLYKWIIDLPIIGFQIRDWNEHGVIERKIKVIAVTTLIIMMTFINYRGVVLWGRIPAMLIMSAVIVFIITRPEDRISR